MNETEIHRMVVRIMGKNSEYLTSLKQSDAATNKYANSVEKQVDKLHKDFVRHHRQMVKESVRAIGNGMKSLGSTMSKGFTLPAVAVGGFSLKAFADFDNAIVESTSIMKVSEEQTQRMIDTALGMSKSGKVLQGPTELARSYFYLASAGKNAEQSMKLLPAVASFATAGAFDMALATDLLTDAQSALGMSSKNVAQDQKNLIKIGDVLVKANTLANASVQQFSESLTSDAATASQTINSELETTVAILALYADKGKKAAESGNLYGRAVRLLTKAARDNSEEFEKYGVNAIDKVTGEYRNFIDILEDINKASAGMTGPQVGALLSDLGFEALAQKSILPLLNSTEQLKYYEAELKKAGGITQEVADKQLTSFSKQMKILWNQIVVAAIGLGKILAPAVLYLNGVVRFALRMWDGLNDSLKFAVVIIGTVLAAIGPLLTAFGFFLTFAAPAIAFLATSFATLGPIIASITFPMVALAGVVIGFIALFLNYMGGLGGLFTAIGKKVSAFIDFVKPVFMAFFDLVSTVFTWIWEKATFVFSTVANIVKEQFDKSISFVMPFFTFMRDMFRDIFNFAEFAFINTGLIIDMVMYNSLYSVIKFYEEVKHFFTIAIPTIISYLADNWRDILLNIFDYTNTVFQNMSKNIVGFFTNLPSLISGKMSFDDVWNPLTEGFKNRLKELPKIPERQKSNLEVTIGTTASLLTTQFNSKLANFFKDKLELPSIVSDKATEDAANEIGKGIKKGTKELEKDVKKALDIRDAVEVGSAEAFARYIEYLNAVPKNSSSSSAASNPFLLNTPTTVSINAGNPFTNPNGVNSEKEQKKSNELLAGIYAETKKKNQIIVFKANLSGS